jgi:hypothetical protein
LLFLRPGRGRVHLFAVEWRIGVGVCHIAIRYARAAAATSGCWDLAAAST